MILQEPQASENEQVLQSLRSANTRLRQEAIQVKLEGALIDAKVITIFLLLVTVVRFFAGRARARKAEAQVGAAQGDPARR